MQANAAFVLQVSLLCTHFMSNVQKKKKKLVFYETSSLVKNLQGHKSFK